MDGSIGTADQTRTLIARMLRQIATDRVAEQKWNTQSLILIYAILIIVLLLSLADTNIWVVASVATAGLLAFWTFSWLRGRRLENQLSPKELHDYVRLAVAVSKVAKSEEEMSSETPLSEREIEILRLVAEGNMNKEIASSLGLSQATVRNHVSRIFRKLDVNDRTAAAVLALSRGWIDSDSEAHVSSEEDASATYSS